MTPPVRIYYQVQQEGGESTTQCAEPKLEMGSLTHQDLLEQASAAIKVSRASHALSVDQVVGSSPMIGPFSHLAINVSCSESL